jgi:hypothetical protein
MAPMRVDGLICWTSMVTLDPAPKDTSPGAGMVVLGRTCERRGAKRLAVALSGDSPLLGQIYPCLACRPVWRSTLDLLPFETCCA